MINHKRVHIIDANTDNNNAVYMGVSEDKIGRPALLSNETELNVCDQSLYIYMCCVSSVYFNHT